MKYLILLLSLASLSVSSKNLPLENISKSDFEDLVGEFSGAFNHTSVTSASKLGKIFGFQVGLIGGLSQTETLDKLIKSADPGSKGLSSIPVIGLSGKVSTPFGLSLEANLIPKFKVEGIEVKNTGVGLSYDLGNAFKIPLLKFGLKATYTKTNFGFNTKDPSSGATVGAEYTADTKGLSLYVGKKFIFVEPYLAVGYVATEGELASSFSLFSYTSANEAEAKKSGAQFIAGANVNLLAFKFGAEYTKLLGTSKIVGKLNFGF